VAPELMGAKSNRAAHRDARREENLSIVL